MFEIREIRQIRLLASPVRQAIIDTLEASGAQSVAGLAAILGYAPDALYHHLRRLSRERLLVAAPGPGSRGRRCTVFALRSKSTRLRYELSNAENRRAISAVAKTMLRDAARVFVRELAHAPVVNGQHRNLWVGRRTGWLIPTELAELNRLLKAINELLERGTPKRRGARLYALTFALSPFGSDRRLR